MSIFILYVAGYSLTKQSNAGFPVHLILGPW